MTGGASEDIRPARVVLADDLESVRVGLRVVLSREPDLEVVGEAVNGRVRSSSAGVPGPTSWS